MATNADVVVAGAVDDGTKSSSRSESGPERPRRPATFLTKSGSSRWSVAASSRGSGARRTAASTACHWHGAHTITVDSYTGRQTVARRHICTAGLRPGREAPYARLSERPGAWSAARVRRGEINVQCAYDFPTSDQMRSRAAAWAPALGESETQDTAQGDLPAGEVRHNGRSGRNGDRSSWNDESGPELPALSSDPTMLQSSPVVARSSPHQASRYPVCQPRGVGHKYVAAATMYDPDNLYKEGFGNAFANSARRRGSTSSTQDLKLRDDLAEDIVSLERR